TLKFRLNGTLGRNVIFAQAPDDPDRLPPNSVVDAIGNPLSYTFAPTLITNNQDTQAPAITNCLSDINIKLAQGQTDTLVTWNFPTVTDNCSKVDTFFNASPGRFGLGTTVVRYVFTDQAGNQDSCVFNITIENDVIESDVVIEASQETSICREDRLVVNIKVRNFEDVTSVSQTLGWNRNILRFQRADNLLQGATGMPTDSTFKFSFASVNGVTRADGSLIYSLVLRVISPTGAGTLIDQVGINNLVTVSGQSVTYTWIPTTVSTNDVTPPTITGLPNDIFRAASPTECSQIVSWQAPIIQDNCGIDSIIVSQASDTEFPIGVTEVIYTAIDESGNRTTASFTVTINDVTAPVFSTCPQDTIIYVSTTATGAIATWAEPSVTDNCSDTVMVSTSHLSGSIFPIGRTTVIYTATDASGNISTSCQFDVIVTNQPPIEINCPNNVTVFASADTCQLIVNDISATVSNQGALSVMSYEFTGATAGFASNLGIVDASGQTFNIGTTNVNYSVADTLGAIAMCSFDVIVADTIAPNIICPQDTTISLLPDENNRVVAGIELVSLSDNCDNNLAITYNINNATSGFGDASGNIFQPGRNTVTYIVRDETGNEATCFFNVNLLKSSIEITCPSDRVVNLVGDLDSCGRTLVTMSHLQCLMLELLRA
ncbi:MAG: HYR domain-containing protein, partial [Saprospiraceae bacterium]|nr:HYR domain-containing protein [Saprospiraceae bacterium]